MPEYPGIPRLEDKGIRDSVSKHVWIKLTGPAAESLKEAFSGTNATVLQENMSANVVTPQAEDTAQKDDGRIKPETVPPTVIVMEGTTAGDQKYIKVQKMYRIVLLGDTGAGKSSLANTIFGEDVFKIENTECQAESKSVHGRRITLINTPDLFGPGRSEEELQPEILKCITECAPGPHAFLTVLKVEKSTEQQQAVIEKISQHLPEEAFKYTTVVLTQDDRVSEGMKIEEFVDQNKCLSDLVKKCKGRYHIINKYNQLGDGISNQSKVAELLNIIDQIVKENTGGWYTTKMLPQGDTCNKTNNSVSKNELIKLTGPAAESLAKAFSGPAVVVLTQRTTNGEEEGSKITDEEAEVERQNEEATSETTNEEQTEEDEKEEEEENKPKRKQRRKSPGSGGFGSLLGALFGFFLGLGTTVLGSIPTFTGVITGLTTAFKAWAMLKVSKVGEWIVQKLRKWVMQKLMKLVTWVIQNICKGIAWIKNFFQLLQDLFHNRGVILLVFVFYSLLLSWLFLKGPFAGTLNTIILIQFLLLFIILAVIEF